MSHLDLHEHESFCFLGLKDNHAQLLAAQIVLQVEIGNEVLSLYSKSKSETFVNC
jgi:hypothetical protein